MQCCCNALSCQADEDAERKVLAVAVAENELSEIEGLVCVLEAECLFDDGLAQNCGVSV